MSRGTGVAGRAIGLRGWKMMRTDLTRRKNGLRPNPWVIALGCTLLACATTHPHAAKRGVIVPSDVKMSGSASPMPAMTETASPGAAPISGTGK